MDRIKPKLSPIHDVLFSGNKIEPHKSIIDNWWLTNNVYALSPFWKDENKNIIYNRVFLIFLYFYIKDKYKHKRNVFVMPMNVKKYYKYKPSQYYVPLRITTSINQKDKFFLTTDFEKILDKKISNSKIQIIVIPCDLEELEHAVSIIINKYLKTIEYYDSNGSSMYDIDNSSIDKDKIAIHIDNYNDIYKYFTKFTWYKEQNYKFLKVSETNLYYGIQFYGDGTDLETILPRNLYKTGWCSIYSLMIHYRIHYYQIEPLVLQKLLFLKI